MIKLWMNELKYENDVRALIMAFYHGEKIIVNPGSEVLNPDTVCLCEMRIDFFVNRLFVSLRDTASEKRVSDWGATVFEDYKQTKNDLKRLVYKVLCAFTGRTLPWGTLTGIRPTKISMQLLD